MPDVTIARCRTCHREERWRDGALDVVLLDGGQRQPRVHPQRAAFDALADAHDRGLTVLGPCAACGQPMLIATNATPAATGAWSIDLPDGPLAWRPDGWARADAPLDHPTARALVDAAYRDRSPRNVGQKTFEATVLTIMMTPLLLWVGAVITAVTFLFMFYQGPGAAFR